MAERTIFLQRLREATARGRAFPVDLDQAATQEAAYVGGGKDNVATLLQEWIAVGGQGGRVHGIAAAQKYIREFLARYQIKSVLRWKHTVLDRLNIDQVLAEVGVPFSRWDQLEQQSSSERWPVAFAAGLGITSVDWAVAETGTLALCSLPGQGRVVSLLPPVYLAIIEPAQIVPDLFDLFAILEQQKSDLPSNISLVTGPSKTGDIELKLTTGVHGPGNVNILVVEPD